LNQDSVDDAMNRREGAPLKSQDGDGAGAPDLSVDIARSPADHGGGGGVGASSSSSLSRVRTLALIAVGTVLYSLHSILLPLQAVEPDGSFAFNFSSVVLVSEIVKFAMALGATLEFGHLADLRSVSGKDALLCVVPGLIYAINNRVAFVVLDGMMDPASYQLLSTIEILTTALLFYFIIGKPLSARQWVSLAILSAGCALAALNIEHAVDDNEEADTDAAEHQAEHITHITRKGFVVMVVYCSLAGLAGVYSEKMLKDTHRSFHVTNTLLFAWGIFFNAIVFIREEAPVAHQMSELSENEYDDDVESPFATAYGRFAGLFMGYNGWTVAIMLNQAFTGLVLSLVMKYLDNIVKLFMVACSLLFTTFWAAHAMGFNVHLTFYLACLCVIIAIELYNLAPHLSVLYDTFSFSGIRQALAGSKSVRDIAVQVKVASRSKSVRLGLLIPLFVFIYYQFAWVSSTYGLSVSRVSSSAYAERRTGRLRMRLGDPLNRRNLTLTRANATELLSMDHDYVAVAVTAPPSVSDSAAGGDDDDDDFPPFDESASSTVVVKGRLAGHGLYSPDVDHILTRPLSSLGLDRGRGDDGWWKLDEYDADIVKTMQKNPKWSTPEIKKTFLGKVETRDDGHVYWNECKVDGGYCIVHPWGCVNTPPCCRQRLTELFVFVVRLMDDMGITHWLCGGSLLTALRQQAGIFGTDTLLARWDWDHDMCTLKSESNKMDAAVARVNEEGTYFAQRKVTAWGTQWMFHVSKQNVMHVDLFMWNDSVPGKLTLKKNTLSRKAVLPIVWGHLGPVRVPLPNSAIAYAQSWFGPDMLKEFKFCQPRLKYRIDRDHYWQAKGVVPFGNRTSINDDEL
jgi:drug/metabolite transporter (DMT)-like permease